jgi:hypothetical protein
MIVYKVNIESLAVLEPENNLPVGTHGGASRSSLPAMPTSMKSA